MDLPGVIKTYSLIEEECYALVQESIQGISLEEYIKQQPHPNKNLSAFYKIATQMVKSIAEIHRKRIIHKDIKPSNFIIEPKTLTVKLTDFNFAVKLLHEVQDVVPLERLVGTLAYMAPEQTGRMNMNVDYRSDFYALGVSLYELLTGDAMICALGEEERLDASVVSDAINTASRVEGLNKYYKTRLLITEPVFKQLVQPEKYLIRLVDRVYLKGKSQATGIYEVTPLPAWELLEAERDYLKLFSEAFGLYEKGDFVGAESIFKRCLEQKPNDYVVVLLMGRCAWYMVSGKPPGWDSTSVFLEK